MCPSSSSSVALFDSAQLAVRCFLFFVVGTQQTDTSTTFRVCDEKSSLCARSVVEPSFQEILIAKDAVLVPGLLFFSYTFRTHRQNLAFG